VGTGTALALIGGMAAVTYLTRLPLFLLAAWRVRIPPLVGSVLEQIPVAAYAVIVFPGVLRPGGHLDLSFSNLYIYAAFGAALTAAARRSLLATIVIGVGGALLLKQLVG
jgi:branched chain amino acid efflux pump